VAWSGRHGLSQIAQALRRSLSLPQQHPQAATYPARQQQQPSDPPVLLLCSVAQDDPCRLPQERSQRQAQCDQEQRQSHDRYLQREPDLAKGFREKSSNPLILAASFLLTCPAGRGTLLPATSSKGDLK